MGMAADVKKTKEEILVLLKKNGALPISEIAAPFGLTEMAIRRHIHTLEKEGFIEVQAQLLTKGRPSKLYQLTGKGDAQFPKQYKELNFSLLEGLQEAGHHELIAQLFTRKTERLLEENLHLTDGKTILEKLTILKDIQTAQGYMAEISEEEEGISFKEFNCPFTDIAKAYPALCTAEKTFIQTFLNVKTIKVKSCISAGGTCCHYIIAGS